MKRSRKFLAILALSSVMTASYCSSVFASGKTEVYVLTKSDNGFVSNYSYNKNGLLIKEKQDGHTLTIKYDAKNRIKSCKSDTTGTLRHSTITYSYDKKGRLSKIDSQGSHGSNTYSYTYYYNKNDLVTKETADYGGAPTYGTFKYNKKKQMTNNTIGGSSSDFTYDKNGNLKSVKTSYNLLKYDNKYDKQKNLIKRVTGISGNKQTCTFKYKKIKVDEKYAKQIKEQQYALLNSDAQLVFPVYF